MPLLTRINNAVLGAKNNITSFVRKSTPKGNSQSSWVSGDKTNRGTENSGFQAQNINNRAKGSTWKSGATTGGGSRLGYSPYGDSNGAYSNSSFKAGDYYSRSRSPTPNVTPRTSVVRDAGKGLGGIAAVKTVPKGNPYVFAVLLFFGILFGNQDTAITTVPEHLRNPGEEKTISESTVPPYGFRLRFYSPNNFQNVEFDVKSYQIFETSPGDRYTHYIEMVFLNDAKGSVNIDPNTLTIEPIPYPEGQEPEPTGGIETASTTNHGNIEVTRDPNAFPPGIRPPFPSDRTANPLPSRSSSRPTETSKRPQSTIPVVNSGQIPEKPPVVQTTVVNPPPSVVEPKERQPVIESPTEIPIPIPTPEAEPERTIEEVENDNVQPEATEEPNIISERVVKRADGTTEVITQREATEEELRDIKRKQKNANKTIEEYRKSRELEIWDPDPDFIVNKYPFGKPEKEFYRETDDVEEITRQPASSIDKNKITPGGGINDEGIQPPEPDKREDETPFIPPPPVRQNETTECKGCNKKIFDRLGGLNLAAQGLDIALVRQIHTTVHHPVHGLAKIQDFAETAWKASGAGKILQTVSAIASLHNAAMLSQNAAQSMGDVITSGLSLFNIKGFDGQPIDVNEAVGGAIQDKLNAILGESNLKTASDIWLKLNRIHMAASSLLYSIQGAKNAVLEADEITGGHLAEIGNALQDQGIIEDETYDWMNPEPDYQEPYKGLYGKLDALENIADRASSVVNAGLEIKEGTTEIIDSAKELTEATDDFRKTYEALQTTDRTNSNSPNVERTDLLKDEGT